MASVLGRLGSNLNDFDKHDSMEAADSSFDLRDSLKLAIATSIVADMTDVTRILNAIEAGDPSASSELLPLVYDELRLLASQRLANEKPGQTLQATALVHEVYLRLVGNDGETSWRSRGHFFGAAAEAMRRIFIERARRKASLKGGIDARRLDFEKLRLAIDSPAAELLALDDAMEALAQENPEKAELVKLRFYAGCTLAVSAEILGISTTTAKRYWATARPAVF